MNLRLAGCGLILVSLIGVGQSLHDGSDVRIGSGTRLAIFVAFQAVAVIVYYVAVADVLRRPSARWTLWGVLAVAVAMRAIPLASPMFLSSDMFRYIWDGRVQLAGINPYAFVPGDEQLAWLRDGTIFPHINRAFYARTIYPPVAEMVFAGVAWLSQTLVAMRLAMVAFEAMAIAALLLLLRRMGAPGGRVLIYAWNPLTAWEFAGNGHVDALAIGFMALALLAFATRRPALTGVALAAAMLTKFLPLVIAPALWRRWDWRMPLAAAAVVIVAYGIYLPGAGWHVLGFLPNYASEEGLRGGDGFWALAGLASVATLPGYSGAVFLATAAILLGAVAVTIFRRPRVAAPDVARACGDAALLIVITLVAFSPHYPWYYLWVTIPAVIVPRRAAIFIGSASLLLYVDPLHERFLWPALLYVPTMILLLSDYIRPLACNGAEVLSESPTERRSRVTTESQRCPTP